jgi:hypothetical protein
MVLLHFVANQEYRIAIKVLKVIYIYIYIYIDWCLTPTLAIFQLYRGVYIVSGKIVRHSIIAKGK